MIYPSISTNRLFGGFFFGKTKENVMNCVMQQQDTQFIEILNNLKKGSSNTTSY
jgi:hypothetical protein